MSPNNDNTIAAFSSSTTTPIVIAQVKHVDISSDPSPNDNPHIWADELHGDVKASGFSARQAQIQRTQEGAYKAADATLNEAISKEVVEPIEITRGALASDYDVDTIIDHALAYDRETETWSSVLDPNDFWEVVERNTTYVLANDEPEGIILYSNDGCPGCSLTAKAFDRAGLEYTEVNLADRPDLIEQFKREGLTSLPIIKDGQGQTISGYRPDRIKAIIDAGSPPKTTPPNPANAGEPVKPSVASMPVKTGVEAPRMSQ